MEALHNGPALIDSDYLKRFPSFREFMTPSSAEVNRLSEKEAMSEEKESPDERFEEAFEKINQVLADELLDEVTKLTPKAFERFAIDLLAAMGYGAFPNAGKTTQFSHDSGIDGVIMEDKLGFNLIYIQAKKWNPAQTVGRPDIQSFVGAIAGKGGKGLFITTARFSDNARNYARQQRIILIDGEQLARLMIEHNFGVSVRKCFEIKAIDTDVFAEYATECVEV